MHLINCPWDKSSRRWILSSAWFPKTCEECEQRPSMAIVRTFDEESGHGELFVCGACLARLIELPKRGDQ